MDQIPYEKNAWYIFDRGCVDFRRLHKIASIPVNFVIRAKSNLAFRRIYSNKANKTNGVKTDQKGVLTGFYAAKNYPDKLRRVTFYDTEQKRSFSSCWVGIL